MPRCKAKTAKGTPCRNNAREGSEFCGMHIPDTKTGRPSKYDPGLYPALVEAHAASPKTDAQMAEKLGISLATLKNWFGAHPEFLAAHKRGRDQLLDDIEMSVYKRASGYSYIERKVETCEPPARKAQYLKARGLIDSDGHMLRVTETVKRIAPDIGAIAIVLFNRRKPGYDPDNPEKGWQSVNRIEVTGKDGKTLTLADLVRAYDETEDDDEG